MSEYDVTDITPADFSKMIQQLADRGALSAQEAQDMAGIRTELDKAGVSPDQSLNLVDFYRQQVAKTQANGAADPASLQKAVTPMLQRLSWLERFAGMHSQPDAVGIDSVA